MTDRGTKQEKTSRVLPWVGWNGGQISFVLVPGNHYGRTFIQRPVVTQDLYIEITRFWWERFAAAQDWVSAAALGKICTERRPEFAYGWENWAWALHKSGQTALAYKKLAPLLKKLKLAGPPSGRAAYCLACFCGALEKNSEGARWLKLAYALAQDKEVFKDHAIRDPDLRNIWPSLPQFGEVALAVLE